MPTPWKIPLIIEDRDKNLGYYKPHILKKLCHGQTVFCNFLLMYVGTGNKIAGTEMM